MLPLFLNGGLFAWTQLIGLVIAAVALVVWLVRHKAA
jgi:hypothetical protein